MVQSYPSGPCRVLALSLPPVAANALGAILSSPGPAVGVRGETSSWELTALPESLARTAVGLVGSHKQAGTPFALVVTSLGADGGADGTTWDALLAADEHLRVLVLGSCTRDGAPPAPTGRLAFIGSNPGVEDLRQMMTLLTSNGLLEREIDRLSHKSEPAIRPAAAPAAQAHRAAPATILVVDDDETIRLVVGQVLGTSNHRVIMAGNAGEALEQWRAHRETIALVITDINMPGEADGLTLGRELQAQDASIPVVYTSGFRATSRFEHLKDGVNYLSKPFGMADLLRVVERNLAEASWHAG